MRRATAPPVLRLTTKQGEQPVSVVPISSFISLSGRLYGLLKNPELEGHESGHDLGRADKPFISPTWVGF